MIFHSYSRLADQALARFNQLLSANGDSSFAILREKVTLCHYEILLITCDEPIPDRLGPVGLTSSNLAMLFEAWQSICSGSCEASREMAWDIIEQVGKAVAKVNYFMVTKEDGDVESRSVLWRLRDEPASRFFFLLLTGGERQGLSAYDLLFLCNLWQIEHEYLPIHATGIIRRGRLYLFAGFSGVGKSTVAAMSRAVGGDILDDDQVVVRWSDAGRYTADAWGYDVRACDAPLQSIFALTQASEDRLIRLRQVQVTRLLIERYVDISGEILSGDLLQRLLRLAAAIARQVPGYELHFRKSPDFWKLIDEQFPD